MRISFFEEMTVIFCNEIMTQMKGRQSLYLV